MANVKVMSTLLATLVHSDFVGSILIYSCYKQIITCGSVFPSKIQWNPNFGTLVNFLNLSIISTNFVHPWQKNQFYLVGRYFSCTVLFKYRVQCCGFSSGFHIQFMGEGSLLYFLIQRGYRQA